MLAKRKIRSCDLAQLIGITEQNLSILKTGKAKAIRFSTLEKICEHLQCQPGDIFLSCLVNKIEKNRKLVPSGIEPGGNSSIG